MKGAVLSVTLALCVATFLQLSLVSGHGHRRGHGPRHVLCSLKDADTGEDIESRRVRECPPEVDCTVGPVQFTLYDGRMVEALFCDIPPPFRPLVAFACEARNATGDVLFSRGCPDQASCSLGPLEVNGRDDEILDAMFCDDVTDAGSIRPYRGVLSQACLIETETEVPAARDCPEDSECTIGPLDVTIDGTDAQAYFCDNIVPRERSPRRDSRGASGVADDADEGDSSSSSPRDPPPRPPPGQGGPTGNQ